MFIFKMIVAFILSLMVTTLSAQDISEERKSAYLDSVRTHPSGMIYFFDNKEVSEVDFYKKALDGELNGISGIMLSGKKAIMQYGERYRIGIAIFNSVVNQSATKEEENESIQ